MRRTREVEVWTPDGDWIRAVELSREGHTVKVALGGNADVPCTVPADEVREPAHRRRGPSAYMRAVLRRQEREQLTTTEVYRSGGQAYVDRVLARQAKTLREVED